MVPLLFRRFFFEIGGFLFLRGCFARASVRAKRACKRACVRVVRGRTCASMLTCLRARVDVRDFLASVCVRTCASMRLLVRVCVCSRFFCGD